MQMKPQKSLDWKIPKPTSTTIETSSKIQMHENFKLVNATLHKK
jgi:hypothetical protein